MVTLRGRLVVVLLAVLAGTSLLLGAALVYLVRSAPQWGEEGRLRGQALALASLLEREAVEETSLRKGPTEAVGQVLRSRLETKDPLLAGLKIILTDTHGTVVVDSEPLYGHRLLRREGETAILTVSVPVAVGGAPAGKLSLSRGREGLGSDPSRRERMLVGAVLFAFGAVLLLFLLGLPWAVRPAVRLAEKLEDAERNLDGTQYVEKYVQTLTHEMKSPLSVLKGAAELLREEMSGDQRKVFLENIRRETERIQDLVDRLLQLSAIEGRRELGEVEHIELASLIREVVNGMAPFLAGKEIDPDCTLEEGTAVWGERFLLRQALANLIKNAVEFSPRGGPVLVRLREVDGRAEISVEDAGPGIPDYALERIFEKFYSLGRPDTGRRSSGLGLPFAREAAALHGGDVAVENLKGGGVRVLVRLPLDPPSGK
jgi:two-component system sensor histidine kinase CreC